MKAKQKKRIVILSIICLVVCVISGILALQYLSIREANLANQIEKSCKSIFTIKYSNEPEYKDARAKLEEAKTLAGTKKFRNKSIPLILQRAESHLDSLSENPMLNYSLSQLEGIISDTINNTPGNWSVYFEIPGTDFKIELNNRTVNAASTIKLFNMVAFYNELNRGNLEMTAPLASQVHSMITVSSNAASNAVTTAIGNGSFAAGARKVTALAHTLGAEDTQEEHMLYDVKTLTPGHNTTSVRDCATILRKLYDGKCVSPEYDAEMLEILKQQTRRFKLPLLLPTDTVIAHKTGENSESELDVGIIYSPKCTYILCLSVTDFGTEDVRQTFGTLSETIYNYLNAQ